MADRSMIHVVLAAENDLVSLGTGERNRRLAPIRIVGWAFDCKVARATSDVIAASGEATDYDCIDFAAISVMDRHVVMN